jgi:LPXTG-site transpeptidase (sortase) family protein
VICRAQALVLVGMLLLGAAAGCGTAGAGGATAHPSAPAAGSPARSSPGPAGSPTEVQLVPPSVRPLEIGSSGLLAPSGVTASRSAPPTRLRIPAIGVDAPVVQLDKGADGTMDVPADSNTPGWYARGPAPGENGPAVILGHLDSVSGPAVFWRLSSLHPGDVVQVQRQDGSQVKFSVSRTATFSVDSFPTRDVYGTSAGPELRLITCGGDYSASRRRYLSNVVAFATLAG